MAAEGGSLLAGFSPRGRSDQWSAGPVSIPSVQRPITRMRTQRRNILRIKCAKTAYSAYCGHALVVGGEAAIGTGVPAIISAPRIVLGIRMRTDPSDGDENRGYDEERLHTHETSSGLLSIEPGPGLFLIFHVVPVLFEYDGGWKGCPPFS